MTTSARFTRKHAKTGAVCHETWHGSARAPGGYVRRCFQEFTFRFKAEAKCQSTVVGRRFARIFETLVQIFLSGTLTLHYGETRGRHDVDLLGLG